MDMKRFITIFASALFALGVAKPASAIFLYDYQTSAGGGTTHVEWTEPSILNTFTTITSFTLATSTFGTVTTLHISPLTSTGSCALSVPPACVDVSISNPPQTIIISSNFAGVEFTHVGLYANRDSTLTITAIPEPSQLLLLVAGLGALFVVARRRLKS
jgi:hypothetical protein